jgi:signal recognition particle subunit SRP54
VVVDKDTFFDKDCSGIGIVTLEGMTQEEKDNPRVLDTSRIRRVARGSGTGEKEVKELLKQYVMMRRMLKTMRRKRKLPFFGKGLPLDLK